MENFNKIEEMAKRLNISLNDLKNKDCLKYVKLCMKKPVFKGEHEPLDSRGFMEEC